MNVGARGTGSNQHEVRSKAATAPTLASLGITKDQSSRYQSLASMSEAYFETAVATAKDRAGEVTTAFMLREVLHGVASQPLVKAAENVALRVRNSFCWYFRWYFRNRSSNYLASMRVAADIGVPRDDQVTVLPSLIKTQNPPTSLDSGFFLVSR